MIEKIILKACPFCATPAMWHKGDEATRMEDRVHCLGCFAEVIGDYTPMSSLDSWNSRASGGYVEANGRVIEIVRTNHE